MGLFASKEARLIKAVQKNNISAVKKLIAQNVDLNAQNVDKENKTALIIAAEYDRTASVRMLIEADARLDLQSKYGYTALIRAAEYGRTDIARILIDAGAKLDLQSKSGYTALMHAVKRNRGEIIKILVRAGARISGLSQEDKEQYRDLLLSTQHPYSPVNDYIVSKYEGEVEGLGSMRQIFNFKAGTLQKCINETLEPVRYFDEIRSSEEQDEVMQAYDFMKEKGMEENIPVPFFRKGKVQNPVPFLNAKVSKKVLK